MTVLVAHASKHGSTREVAEAVAAVLEQRGVAVDVQPAAVVDDVGPYDAVVLGGALYFGRWHADARAFLERHRAVLAPLPLAVFALGPVGDTGTLEESRAELDRALAGTPELEPFAVGVFGGVIDPSKLRFPLSRMKAQDSRDWDAIRAWAEAVAAAPVS